MDGEDVAEETALMSGQERDDEPAVAAPARPGGRRTAGERVEDELGEASFPASDPPASWTWDVAGHAPGSATPG
jgi:hypothetical protein